MFEKEFSSLRAFFWPIRRAELPRYLPIFLVAFFLGVNYEILRNLKYGLLVLAPEAGAEAIPFVQLWGLVPGALLMTYLLARLCRRWPLHQVFSATVLGFTAFFLLFLFVLLPMHEQLEPTRLVAFLKAHLPSPLNGFIAIVRHWVYSLFYVAAELWKVSVLAVLFWGYINNNIGLSQATRFYGPLTLAASLAGIVGGSIAHSFPTAQWVQQIGFGANDWHRALNMMMIVVVFIGLTSLIVFQWIVRQTTAHDREHHRDGNRKQAHFSIRQAFRTLKNSRYLLCLGFIVAADYVAFGLAEILWKDQLKVLYPNPCDFTAYTGRVILWSSIVSVVATATLSGGIINKVGWRVAAFIGLLILAVTSAAFYFFVLCRNAPFTASVAYWLGGATPLSAAVFFGAVHNCLCRVGKKALIDPTKELAFVPLDQQTRTEGKAIIDGVGMHAGRAGGALVQQVLLFCFPTVIAGAPVSALVIAIIGVAWFKCANYVGNQFRQFKVQSPTETVLQEPKGTLPGVGLNKPSAVGGYANPDDAAAS